MNSHGLRTGGILSRPSTLGGAGPSRTVRPRTEAVQPPGEFPGNAQEWRTFQNFSGMSQQDSHLSEAKQLGAEQIKKLRESIDKLEKAHKAGNFMEAQQIFVGLSEGCAGYNQALDYLLTR